MCICSRLTGNVSDRAHQKGNRRDDEDCRARGQDRNDFLAPVRPDYGLSYLVTHLISTPLKGPGNLTITQADKNSRDAHDEDDRESDI